MRFHILVLSMLLAALIVVSASAAPQRPVSARTDAVAPAGTPDSPAPGPTRPGRPDAGAEAAGTLRTVPATVAFQGFLVDSTGHPIDGTVNLDVALYAVPSGGTALWGESHVGVNVTDGVFAIALGSVVSFPGTLFSSAPRYLGVSVGVEPELPRTELRSAPFAVQAREADHALTADTAANVPLVLDDLSDVNAPSPLTGEVLQFDGADWSPATLAPGTDSDWTINGTDMYANPSVVNVGIGTTAPFSPLHVEGDAFSTMFAFNHFTGVAQIAGQFWTDSTGTGTRTAVEALAIGNTLTSSAIHGVQARVETHDTAGGAYGVSSTIVGSLGETGEKAGFWATVDASPAAGTASSYLLKGFLFANDSPADMFGSYLGMTSNGTLATGTAYGSYVDYTQPARYSTKYGFYSVGEDYNYFSGDIGIGTTTPSERLHVAGNVYAAGGDFYTASGNGVINCGGGIMNANANVLADFTPTIAFATGDEDLYIDDDLELGAAGQGYKPGGGSWAAVSDARLKTDVRPYEDGLETVLRMRPKWYRYNEKSFLAGDREYVGVTAQDMLQVAPYMVEEKALWQVVEEDETGKEKLVDPGEKYYTYDSSALIYMLVNAVQEQQEQIDVLREEVRELERAR